jgi:PAS domain S-box-containing protein
MMSRLEGNQFLLALYGLLKMKLHYLFGEPGAAYDHVEEVLKHRGSVNPAYLYTKISFYGALACVAGLSDPEDEAARKERLEKLQTFEEELRLWSETAPMNYRHEHLLLQAEKSRVTNDHWKAVQLYDDAITAAQENGFVHEEALANELCAPFWQERGNDRIAETYMREAHALYHRWGAVAKVNHLEDCYPQWFKTRTTREERPDASGTVDTPVTRPITPIQMELDGVIAASHTLSSETDVDRLLTTMMDLVMANSGAERAVLLLRQGTDWFLQARGDVATGEKEVLLNRAFDPADSEADLVPESVFHCCRRSKEVLVVGDAHLDHRFAENSMIQTQRVKSMLCLPALSQGQLKAMVYLENRQMADVFTQERVAVLEHLSAQFAIAVENALLYNSLQQKIGEIKEREERYDLAVSGSAAGIWDWDILSNDLYTSDRLRELLGYAPDELDMTMEDFWNFLHPEDSGAVEIALAQHIKNRKTYNIEYRLRTKSGEYRWNRYNPTQKG